MAVGDRSARRSCPVRRLRRRRSCAVTPYTPHWHPPPCSP
jgi:hypothetical protein